MKKLPPRGSCRSYGTRAGDLASLHRWSVQRSSDPQWWGSFWLRIVWEARGDDQSWLSLCRYVNHRRCDPREVGHHCSSASVYIENTRWVLIYFLCSIVSVLFSKYVFKKCITLRPMYPNINGFFLFLKLITFEGRKETITCPDPSNHHGVSREDKYPIFPIS